MDDKLNAMLDRSMDNGTLDPNQIPELDLYIDQIIMLMENHVGKQEDGQPPLTRTMIHNYSKAGLISPVKGKKYSKEHIMQMFAIYSLKNTLSIAQIKRVLCGIEEDAEQMKQSYLEYLQGRQVLREATRDTMEQMMKDITADNRQELFPRLLLMADAAQLIADYARSIADECYPEPPAKGKKK